MEAYAQELDGLVLMGGSDVCPEIVRREGVAARMERRSHPRRLRDRAAARVHGAAQARARRVPRRAGDQRRAGRNALPGPLDAGAARAQSSQLGDLRGELPRHVVRARQRPRPALSRHDARQDQLDSPSGRQGRSAATSSSRHGRSRIASSRRSATRGPRTCSRSSGIRSSTRRTTRRSSTTRRYSTTSSPPRHSTRPRRTRFERSHARGSGAWLQASGATMKITNPATGAVIAEVAADNAAAVRRKYEAARAGQRRWAARAVRKRLEAIAAFRERIVATHEKLARTLTQEVGKPIRQSRNELTGLLRADRFLSRGVRARAARGKGLRRRQEDGRADHARAARRDRQHLGVELSLLRREQRVRAGARRRQRRALQAVGVRDADRALDRGDAARSRRSARRVRSGRRRRRDRRRARPPAGRRRLLHRLVRDRRADRRVRRPADDQGPARARRQGSRLRLRGRRRQGRRGGYRRRRVLQHRPIVLLGRAHLRARIDPRRVRRGVRRRGERLQASATRWSESTYIGAITRKPQLDVLKKQVKDAKKKGAKLLIGGSVDPRQGQLVRADGVRRRRPFDGADEGRELRTDHRHSGGRR